jgi:hypothetical protein
VSQPQRDQVPLAADHDSDYGLSSELPRVGHVSRARQRPQCGGLVVMGHQGMGVVQVVASITLPESSISGWAITLALASGFSSLPSP